jgi:hypothetical protein
LGQRTWLTLLEAGAIAALLLLAPAPALRVLLGLPLLAHLAWTVLTSVPVGRIPGPPPGVGERRRNHRLRYRVVEFLREVKRLEAYARRAPEAKVPRAEVDREFKATEERLRHIVSEILRVAGQTGT